MVYCKGSLINLRVVSHLPAKYKVMNNYCNLINYLLLTGQSNGPPESPWHESGPPSRLPAHIMPTLNELL